ncbi:MAG: ATP-dependent helicase [Actinomycetota bacterium]
MGPVRPLEAFSAPTRAWFTGAFAAPTEAQLGAWQAAQAGGHALVVAPTGSGKTLAAFLWALDRLATTSPPADPRRRCRIVYVSPLKALAVDVERNLRAPLAGIEQAAARLGGPAPDITVAIRSGDTPGEQRRRFARRPPDILITTPESLFLVLTSQARQALAGVTTVIIDEVHAVAGTKRGAHLALSLERLDALLQRPAQRIGLSATVRPVEEVAAFLGGARPVTVVAPPAQTRLELQVVVPVPDLTDLGQPATGASASAVASPEARASIWPHVEERLVDLVERHRSTIVFANSRRGAERLTARLNEIAWERRGEELPDLVRMPAALMGQAGATRGAPAQAYQGPGSLAQAHQRPVGLAQAHHGSVSKERRAQIEDDLKSGRLPAVVATSSLELGIDMGAVDLVVQVAAPPSVANGLQRVGRAGHQVGAVSRGVLFPTHRGDLLLSAVVAERMRAGAIEALRYPRNPLDVLAQQVVAMVAMDDWPVDELGALVRRAAPFAGLPESAYEAVLDMLSGRYPSDEFAELRPRVVWDRTSGTLRGRPGAQRLAVTSGGTIPDRGLFGVYLVGERQSRVGELDEEMVYESRVGDVFTLGTTSWRIEDITHDRVLVTPAPGQPGRLPFWHGDAAGRPLELGRALGAFVRELGRLGPAARDRVTQAGLDGWAADNLLAYLDEQRTATGHVPDDRTVVVERFRDELGDWRVAVHSPFGARVHAPWALAIAGRLRERFGVDVQAMPADDGIVLRLPDTEDRPPLDLATFAPDEIEDLVTAEVVGSALFAARFRECAARALLLPRRTPGRRSPLWQQRQRSAQLLAVASRFGSFPVVLETLRECLQDVFDVPGLVTLMADLAARRIRFVDVETAQPSPFARSLLFGYVAQFMYEGDSPLAERRAAALTLDATLLAELLGRAELRELLDPGAVDDVVAALQRLTPERRARTLEETADLLAALGPLSTREAVDRGATPTWLAELEATHRALRGRVAGEERWAAVTDAARLRDALGMPLPVGVPGALREPVADPLGDLVSRYARTHGPFTAAEVAGRFGLGVAVVTDTLHRLATAGRVVRGEFRPGGRGEEWCDAGVLRLLRRRSLAALRREVEPVPAATLGRFLPAWQHVGDHALRGVDGLLAAVEQLQGAAVPASALESLVLPARVLDYQPGMLDELTAAGEVLWAGLGRLPGGDGWVTLLLPDTAPLLLPPAEEVTATPLHAAVLAALDGDVALFFRTLADRLVAALWDLVWAGRVTNDTLGPLRAARGGRPRPPRRLPRRETWSAHRPRPGRRIPPRWSGPPELAGRWSLLPPADTDPTRRTHAAAERLLARHGVLTRGAVVAERLPGGFAAAYRVLSAAEEAGRCRRGYFVEGLGAAQFAEPGAVDRLRGTPEGGPAVVLPAADPAQPYGAALPWPPRDADTPGHRPGRKAGALVVLVAGHPVLYVEKGGRTLLTWSGDPALLQPAADALALAVRDGHLGRLTVERADGTGMLGSPGSSPVGDALAAAGFHPTPRGLRLRG